MDKFGIGTSYTHVFLVGRPYGHWTRGSQASDHPIHQTAAALDQAIGTQEAAQTQKADDAAQDGFGQGKG